MGEATQRAHNTAQSIETTREYYRSPSEAEKHHLQSAETRAVDN